MSASRGMWAAPLAVVALLVAACGASSTPTSTTAALSSTTQPPTTTTVPTTTSTVATTTTIATTTTSTLPPLPPLPPELAAQVDELIAVTEELRGLSFLSPPMIEVVTPDEVVERRRTSLAEDLDPDEIAYEEAFFELFGIFPSGTDLLAFYTEFYSASTLAYYNLEEQRLVVPLEGDTLNEYEKWIVVHELTHALMDQHFGEVADIYEFADETSDFDQIGAILSLLEGEAVLVQTLYLESLPVAQRNEVVELSRGRSNPVFASAPFFFRELLRFPYTTGSQLTVDLYRRGGMEALNQAFGRPPDSTEQVIHPESYVVLEPELEVAEVDIQLDGYEIVEAGSWGERGWRLLLDHHLGTSASVEASEGWGGDHYQMAWNGEDVIFAVTYIGDSFGDASELTSALTSFVPEAIDVDDSVTEGTTIVWTGESYAYLARTGDQLVFVAASDPAAGAAYVASLDG